MSRKIEANNDSGKGRNPEEIGKKKIKTSVFRAVLGLQN